MLGGFLFIHSTIHRRARGVTMAASRTTRRSGAGDGWGGPAKGASDHNPAPQFEPGNQSSVGRPNPSLSGIEKAQALKDHLYKLATEAEREETQVRAAEAWLNRHEGSPVARTVNYNSTDVTALDDRALADRRAELERDIGSGSGGTA